MIKTIRDLWNLNWSMRHVLIITGVFVFFIIVANIFSGCNKVLSPDNKQPLTKAGAAGFHYKDSVCFEDDFYVRCCGFVESRRGPDVYEVHVYQCNGSSVYNSTPLIRGNDLKHVERKDW